MRDLPDVVGFYLNDALEICKACGYEVEILLTRPTKAQPEGKPRVVRFGRVSDNEGVLTVVFE